MPFRLTGVHSGGSLVYWTVYLLVCREFTRRVLDLVAAFLAADWVSPSSVLAASESSRKLVAYHITCERCSVS
jgi:hypothetical protein